MDRDCLLIALQEAGLIVFGFGGHVSAAFENPEEAFQYARDNAHKGDFVYFPSGTQLQVRFAILDGKPQFLARAKAQREVFKIVPEEQR